MVVRLETNLRKMKELIDTSKRDKAVHSTTKPIAKHESVVTGIEWDVDEMKKKVDTAKSKLKKEQNNIEKEVKMQEDNINELEYQVRLVELKVKEKDKELSLATLKTKELKRNIRFNLLKPLSSTPGPKTARKVKNMRLLKSIEGDVIVKRRK